MATNVIIPASFDEPRPRAPLPGLVDADGLGAGLVDEDPVEDEGVPPVALALKASKVLSALGLTAKTIPDLQCVPCLQKNHKGAEALTTVKLH